MISSHYYFLRSSHIFFIRKKFFSEKGYFPWVRKTEDFPSGKEVPCPENDKTIPIHQLITHGPLATSESCPGGKNPPSAPLY